MKKHTFGILAVFCALALSAFGGTKTTRNPVIGGWYADPQIRIYNGQYWIYATYSDAGGKILPVKMTEQGVAPRPLK